MKYVILQFGFNEEYDVLIGTTHVFDTREEAEQFLSSKEHTVQEFYTGIITVDDEVAQKIADFLPPKP